MNGRSSAEQARCTHVLSVRVLDLMNNYQEETLKELLKDVKVRCSVCHSKMIRVIDLYDDTLIGYSCEHCPHYNLLDNKPI